ncbi:MAG: DUF6155 family protein [Bacteroidia bacterium]|nr:DUF6155 family protein [Bacteroidia bacterium]
MGLIDIKKELKKLDKDKLVVLVADLYKKNKSVKEFFDFYINPNESDLFEKYKAKVYEAFFPVRGYKFRLSEGKKAISDFKKLGPSEELLADLMLFYVETGIVLTNTYGDIDEPFYNSLTSVYSQALTLMKKEKILDNFSDRAKKVVDDTRNIGWGFNDELGDIYSDFYLNS